MNKKNKILGFILIMVFFFATLEVKKPPISKEYDLPASIYNELGEP